MSYDGLFLIRDLTTGAQTLQTNVDLSVEHPNDLAISPDAKLLAVSYEAGIVRLFERETLRPIDTLRGFLMENVFSVCFSLDGKRLATTSGGREAIKLWDVNGSHEVLRLEAAGQGMFEAARFSPDGNILGAVRAGDTTLHLWRAPSWADIAAAEAKEKAENRQP